MVPRLGLLVATLLLALNGAASAQEPITLEQAVAAALAGNAGLKAAEAGVRESAARMEGARDGMLTLERERAKA